MIGRIPIERLSIFHIISTQLLSSAQETVLPINHNTREVVEWHLTVCVSFNRGQSVFISEVSKQHSATYRSRKSYCTSLVWCTVTPHGLDRVGSLWSVWLPLAHVLGFTLVFKDGFSSFSVLFFPSSNILYEYTNK